MKRTWIGKYFDINEKGVMDEVPFRIDAVMEEDKSFSGTVWEEEFYILSREFQSVKGFVQDNVISFIVTYPFGYFREEDGKSTIDKDEPGHDVVYEGYWEEETASWKGTWEIEIGIVESGAEYDIIQHFQGDFEMQPYEESTPHKK